MKTIIYGGAFDPPHMAHEHIVRMIAEKYNPERLLIVPTGSRLDKAYKVSLEHRIKILSIFAEDLTDIGAELCDDFMVGRIMDGTTLGVDESISRKIWTFSDTGFRDRCHTTHETLGSKWTSGARNPKNICSPFWCGNSRLLSYE